MWELRWVLLGLGALLVVGVYLWTRGAFRRLARTAAPPGPRTEPTLDEPAREIATPVESATIDPPPARKPMQAAPDRIVALRLIPREGELNTERAVAALHDGGLEHGRYGIFHLHDPRHRDEAVFSVASLTEPGTFDLANLADTTIAGLSFFIVLPGTGDPVVRFDKMIETARGLAVELDADLHDERGSSWSVQRERYVREEIIEYRHQLERL
jgi:cell division protein ZipA